MNLLEYLAALGAVQLVLSSAITRYYASSQTSLSTMALAAIAFALGFSGTVLLPIDLSFAKINNKQKDDELQNMMLPWHILFWSTFILAWIVLPLVREMLLSGEFTAYTRLKDAFRTIIQQLLILFALVVVFIIWLAFHLKEINVIPVLITLANTYGLLLVALLLGYGLINFPRSLWRSAKPGHEIQKVYLSVVKADDQLFQAVWSLQDVEYAIDIAVSKIVDLDENCRSDVFYKYCVNELLHQKHLTVELCPELSRRRTTGRRNADEGEQDRENSDNSFALVRGAATDDPPQLKELIKLNRKLKRAQENLFNAHQKWNGLLEKHSFFSGMDPDSKIDLNITNSMTLNADDERNENGHSKSNSETSRKGKAPLSPKNGDAPLLAPTQTCRSRIKYVWIRFLRSCVYRLMAAVAAIMSLAILWSEATLATKYNLSPFSLVQEYLSNDDDDQNGILFQIAALIPLLYMSICVANGLFQVGRFGPYCLRGNRQSHGVALVFNAQYLVRLQFPLAYNYLLMLKYDTSETAFSKFIGQMDVVPLFGKSFPVYAPLLILFLCAFTLCNVYAKVLNVMGLEHQDALLVGDQDTLEVKINEGKTLLRRYASTAMAEGGIQSSSSADCTVELSESNSWRERGNSIV